jgi:toxin-antitoxin system PIN domain toxin
MLMPDVNVLLYAHRRDEAAHEPYRRWLADLASGSEPFALSALAAIGFVRIATNPRAYTPATPLETALAMIDSLRARPRCRWVLPADDHWQRVSDLSRRAKASGKLIADAQHAALAMAEGCTFVSRDKDFGRFAKLGLRWEHLVL